MVLYANHDTGAAGISPYVQSLLSLQCKGYHNGICCPDSVAWLCFQVSRAPVRIGGITDNMDQLLGGTITLRRHTRNGTPELKSNQGYCFTRPHRTTDRLKHM